jgi:hypothetical protein
MAVPPERSSELPLLPWRIPGWLLVAGLLAVAGRLPPLSDEVLSGGGGGTIMATVSREGEGSTTVLSAGVAAAVVSGVVPALVSAVRELLSFDLLFPQEANISTKIKNRRQV